MRAIIACFLIVVLFVAATTFTGCRQNQREIVLILGFDTSASSEYLVDKIEKWTLRLYGQSDSDSLLTICQLSTENVTAVHMRKGLPQPEEVVSDEFRQLYATIAERGTRPLKFLEYALAEARKHPDKQFVISIFTDGENDFPEDAQALETICNNLVMQENVIQIGFLGLKPLDNKKVANWNSWFGTSDRVVIATYKLNSTDQAINQLCAKAKKFREASIEANNKGGQ